MNIIEEMNRLEKIKKAAAALVKEKESGLYFDVAKCKPGRRRIRTLRQAEKLRRLLLAERGAQYTISKITVLRGGGFRLGVTSCSYSRLSNFINIGPGVARRATTGRFHKFARYSPSVVQLKIEDLPSKYSEGFVQYLDRFAIYKADDEFYLNREGDGEHLVCISHPDKTGSLKELDFVDEDGNLRDGILVYGHYEGMSSEANPTPGEIKKATITMVALNDVGYSADALKYALTYGASRCCLSNDASEKDVAQMNARLSQFMAPNTPLGYLKSFAVFMGKIKAPDGNEYRDGWGFAVSNLVSKLLTMLSRGKYDVDDEAVEGMLLQCRPYLCKLMAEVVSKEYLDDFVDKLIGGIKENLVILCRDKLTAEDQAEFNLGCLSKGEKGKFAKKIVVIVNTYSDYEKYGIQFLTDLNGLKAPFDLSFETTLNVLDMSHGTEDVATGASLSSQLVQSLMIANWHLTLHFIVAVCALACSKLRTAIFGGEGHAPSSKELESPCWNMLLSKMIPSLATKHYFPIYRQLVDKGLKGLVNKVGRLNGDVAGFYAKVISDPAMDFGINILEILDDGSMEVLAPLASRLGVLYGIAVKYPKQHYLEFGKLVFISYEKYARRVAQRAALGDISQKDAMLLLLRAKRISEGAVVMPAYEKVKNMLAGMDYDGDAVIVYIDRMIVSIMSKLTPLAVVIPPADGDSKKGYKIDENVGFTALANSIRNANLDVGAVTVLHLVFSVLYTRIKHGTGEYKNLLKVVFGI